jgi:hypothetical protein
MKVLSVSKRPMSDRHIYYYNNHHIPFPSYILDWPHLVARKLKLIEGIQIFLLPLQSKQYLLIAFLKTYHWRLTNFHMDRFQYVRTTDVTS